MPRVLLPSDNGDFVHYLAHAYRRAGWDAVVGVANFHLAAAEFDVIHVQWPEELCEWQPPTQANIGKIMARLHVWGERARLVMTVHNLAPHRDGDHPGYRQLYEAFYARIDVFAHFTETSRRLARESYRHAGKGQHIVCGYFSMDHLVPRERDAAAARTEAGFSQEEWVLLVLGGLREWDEVKLVRDAFDRARLPGKRLLMAARYDEACGPWRLRWRRWSLRRWLQARRAVVHSGFIPDPEMHRVVDAADAVVLPRFRSLNSGLPAVGASFGKAIIAPDCGAYPELLDGTANPIYAAGDAAALASALEKAAALDRRAVAEENRRLAATWSWDEMVARIIAAL